MKEKGLYWICQLLFWGLLTGFLLVLLFFSSANSSQRFIWLQFIIGGSLLLVSHGMRVYMKKNGWVKQPLRWLLPRLLLLNLLAAVVAQILIHGQMILFLDWLNYRSIVFSEVLVYVFNVHVFFWLWCLWYYSAQYFRRYRNSEVEKWKLQALLREAELTALKAQINPHFIFNALNNIRGLTRENGDCAREMITCLSDLLRYAVDMSRQEEVTVAEEMAIIEDYLRLESVHYEERLQYSLEVAPETLSLRIPPMSIQLLVENAIKHGISLLQGGGFVKISVHYEQNSLMVEVENSGQLKQKEEALRGAGLRIIQERMRLLYGSENCLKLSNCSAHAVRASFQIPQKKTA